MGCNIVVEKAVNLVKTQYQPKTTQKARMVRNQV